MPRQYSFGPRDNGKKDLGFSILPDPENKGERVAIQSLVKDMDVLCANFRRLNESFNETLAPRKAKGQYFPVYSYTQYHSAVNKNSDGKVWSIISQMDFVEYKRGGTEGIDLFLISENEKNYCMEGPAAMSRMLPMRRHDVSMQKDISVKSFISKDVPLNKGFEHWEKIFNNQRVAALCLSFYALQLEQGALIEIVYPESMVNDIRDLIDELYNFISPSQRWKITYNTCINTIVPFTPDYTNKNTDTNLRFYRPHSITGFMIGKESRQGDIQDEMKFNEFLTNYLVSTGSDSDHCIKIHLEEIASDPRLAVSKISEVFKKKPSVTEAVDTRFKQVVEFKWDLKLEGEFPGEFYCYSTDSKRDYQQLLELKEKYDKLSAEEKKLAEGYFGLNDEIRDQLKELLDFNNSATENEKKRLQQLKDFDDQLQEDSAKEYYLKSLLKLEKDCEKQNILEMVLDLGKKMNDRGINADTVKEWSSLLDKEDVINDVKTLQNLVGTLSIKDSQEFLKQLETIINNLPKEYEALQKQEAFFNGLTEQKLKDFANQLSSLTPVKKSDLTESVEDIKGELNKKIDFTAEQKNYIDGLTEKLKAVLPSPQIDFTAEQKNYIDGLTEKLKAALPSPQNDFTAEQKNYIDGLTEKLKAALPSPQNDFTIEQKNYIDGLARKINAVSPNLQTNFQNGNGQPTMNNVQIDEIVRSAVLSFKDQYGKDVSDDIIETVKDRINNYLDYVVGSKQSLNNPVNNGSVAQSPQPPVSNYSNNNQTGISYETVESFINESIENLIKNTIADCFVAKNFLTADTFKSEVNKKVIEVKNRIGILEKRINQNSDEPDNSSPDAKKTNANKKDTTGVPMWMGLVTLCASIISVFCLAGAFGLLSHQINGIKTDNANVSSAIEIGNAVDAKIKSHIDSVTSAINDVKTVKSETLSKIYDDIDKIQRDVNDKIGNLNTVCGSIKTSTDDMKDKVGIIHDRITRGTAADSDTLKTEPPKTEPPKTEPPKTEASKKEATKKEATKKETTKKEAPNEEKKPAP